MIERSKLKSILPCVTHSSDHDKPGKKLLSMKLAICVYFEIRFCFVCVCVCVMLTRVLYGFDWTTGHFMDWGICGRRSDEHLAVRKTYNKLMFNSYCFFFKIFRFWLLSLACVISNFLSEINHHRCCILGKMNLLITIFFLNNWLLCFYVRRKYVNKTERWTGGCKTKRISFINHRQRHASINQEKKLF